MLDAIKIGMFSSTRARWVDPLIYIVALLVLITAFVVNFYWPALPIYITAVVWLLTVAIVIGLIGVTKKGLALLKFSKESRIELRKVHWPTRQETLQTTLMVVVMVVVVGLFLWGIDALFIWGVNALTGQRG